MKTKIWVLSTVIPGDNQPCRPFVFSAEDPAELSAEVLVREDWEASGPIDEEGNPEPWPGDWRHASATMVGDGEGAYGGWGITSHEVDVAIPQAFLDLLELARPLMEECGDYRMGSALRACDALVEASK